jgi:DNA-binding NtrC family response regulator
VETINLDNVLGAIERELIQRALLAGDGNRALAARLLGISRARLLRRLEALGLPD